MMRRFNTERPVVKRKHYCKPPLERMDLKTVLGLIRDERYFTLHAPRQTGKTSVLLALQDLLNSGSVAPTVAFTSMSNPDWLFGKTSVSQFEQSLASSPPSH